MNTSNVVAKTAEFVERQMSSDATGHDWHHVWRVWRTARWLAEREGADLLVVDLAALLHDVADWKFHDGNLDAAPNAARNWLSGLSVDAAVIDHVCEIVGSLSYKGAGVKTPMASTEGEVVQDADRLDAIGAIGVARAFAYGAHIGQSLHDPDCPPTPHKSFAEYRKKSSGTINHFHEKLLLLKDRMNTQAARRLAEDRHIFLKTFLRQFHGEWFFPENPPGQNTSDQQ